MKVGDLVKWRTMVGRTRPITVGIVTRVFDHKCWRTDELGKKVNFSQIDPELFAEVFFSGSTRRIPACDLEVVGG